MNNATPQENLYDLIIIGAGPAGYTAGIYATRYRIKNLVIGKSLGGLITDAHKICNFPTRREIGGSELAKQMKEHLEEEGGTVIQDRVEKIEKNNSFFKIKTSQGTDYQTKTVLIATGTKRRKLGLPREEDFLGKGVSYCATCDAMFFRNKRVAVVGGSDAAHTASLVLADVAKKVFQIYRRDQLRGTTAWVEQVKNNPKIEVIYNTNVTGLQGKNRLEKINLDKPYQEKNNLEVAGLFIEIGSEPETTLDQSLNLAKDSSDYIKINSNQSTNINGIYAAGDITTGSNKFRQAITACGEGAVAANSIYKYLKTSKDRSK
ncbi:MAG: FAD-dependent oxidoreductase [Patescibacteria group bacterium]|nr:FAD-dependent oxidoreductase [Patescibacteria group bacterium]